MIAKDMENIHAYVWDSKDAIFKSHKKDPAECTVISCSNKNNCSLYKKGECILLATFPTPCHYGKRTKLTGFTAKANKYREWINDKKETYRDVLGKLKSASKKLAIIGDYVWLPYAHINMNKDIPFAAHSHLFSSGIEILPISEFTIDTIKSIIKFKPQALFGGEIISYQKEEIPKFVKHLSEELPELFNEANKDGLLSLYLTSYSYVGRTALLSSINLGDVKESDNIWHWDGEYMTLVPKKKMLIWWSMDIDHIKIKPIGDTWVKIHNNNQVNNNTIFKD